MTKIGSAIKRWLNLDGPMSRPYWRSEFMELARWNTRRRRGEDVTAIYTPEYNARMERLKEEWKLLEEQHKSGGKGPDRTADKHRAFLRDR